MRLADVERAATKLLHDQGVSSPPVDVHAIASALDISLRYERMASDISGLLVYRNQSARVAINQYHHRNRQRFTLAHEIGHVVLHAEDEDRVFVDKRFFRNELSSRGELREEIEANAFAASLLMPKYMIGEHIVATEGITDIEVFRLSTKFEVSEQAMTLRLVRLGYIKPD